MEIIRICECFKSEGDRFVFIYTKVLFTCNKTIQYGHSPQRISAHQDEILSSMRDITTIPIEAYCPTFTIDMTIAPNCPANVFIKRPDLAQYDQDTFTHLWQLVSREIKTFEVLLRHPHPNIVAYYGCEVSDGRVAGLCLQACEITVQDLVNPKGLNKRALQTKFSYDINDGFDQYFVELESALQHLHNLGMAHNDLNPNNLTICNGHLILIDFDSCLPFGEPLEKVKRTPEWHDPEAKLSAAQNDLDALNELKIWLSRSERAFLFE